MSLLLLLLSLAMTNTIAVDFPISSSVLSFSHGGSTDLCCTSWTCSGVDLAIGWNHLHPLGTHLGQKLTTNALVSSRTRPVRAAPSDRPLPGSRNPPSIGPSESSLDSGKGTRVVCAWRYTVHITYTRLYGIFSAPEFNNMPRPYPTQ